MSKNKKMREEEIIFKCDCGHPGFLEFNRDEDGMLWIMMTDEPGSFWHWLKMWLKRKVYHSEVMLWKKDQERLKRYFEKI